MIDPSSSSTAEDKMERALGQMIGCIGLLAIALGAVIASVL